MGASEIQERREEHAIKRSRKAKEREKKASELLCDEEDKGAEREGFEAGKEHTHTHTHTHAHTRTHTHTPENLWVCVLLHLGAECALCVQPKRFTLACTTWVGVCVEGWRREGGSECGCVGALKHPRRAHTSKKTGGG